jgi:hypothetical protein
MTDKPSPNLPHTHPSRHVTHTSHAHIRTSHPYAPTHHLHALTHRAHTHPGTSAHHLRPRAFASPKRVLMRFLPLRGNFFIRKKTSKKIRILRTNRRMFAESSEQTEASKHHIMQNASQHIAAIFDSVEIHGFDSVRSTAEWDGLTCD